MSRTRKIADIAVFAAIGIVINIASFPPSIVGRVSLVYAYCFLAGIFIGPVNGMVAVMVADILGWIISSAGGPFVPHIMVTNGLMALLAGLSVKHIKWKKKSFSIVPVAIISFVFLTIGLSAWGESMILFDIYPYALAKNIGAVLDIESKFLMVAMSKMVTQPFWILVNMLITIAIVERVDSAVKSNQERASESKPEIITNTDKM